MLTDYKFGNDPSSEIKEHWSQTKM